MAKLFLRSSSRRRFAGRSALIKSKVCPGSSFSASSVSALVLPTIWVSVKRSRCSRSCYGFRNGASSSARFFSSVRLRLWATGEKKRSGSRRACACSYITVWTGTMAKLSSEKRRGTISSSPLTASFIGDLAQLQAVQWDGLVLDEAQNIKNPQAKQTRALRRLAAPRRLALTGTPVENRLQELWSIMEFLNPGYLGAEASFRRRYALPIERYRDSTATEELRRLVEPFLASTCQDRSYRHPRSSVEERDEGLLHADQGARHALPSGGPRQLGAHRILRRNWPERRSARGAHPSQTDLQPPSALSRGRQLTPRPLGKAHAPDGDARGSASGRRSRDSCSRNMRRWGSSSSGTCATNSPST